MTAVNKKITALRQQKKNKERVSIFLDGKFAFGVSLDAALGLKKGQQLTQDEIDQLKQSDGYDKAFNDALRYLGIRPRSRLEVATFLSRKAYIEDVVESTLTRLEDYNYLDDEAFARMWVADRERFRPRGERALRYELRQKGIDEDTITLVVAEVEEGASAWAALEPKIDRWRQLDDQSFKKKVVGYLGRRGFTYDTIYAAIERALANDS